MEQIDIQNIIKRNENTKAKLFAKYDPITGEGSNTCTRKEFYCKGITDKPILIPADCFDEPLIINLHKCKSLRTYCRAKGIKYIKQNINLCIEEYHKARSRHDFEFWTATCVYIKDRNTENDIPFVLNLPQREALTQIYQADKAGQPVRLIVLKSRQNGISTLVQIYFGWKQLVVIGQWHSVICAHIENTARIIRGMYSKMLKKYPPFMLNNPKPLELAPFENSVKTRIVKEVGCRITIGSAKNPDSVVGDNISMAHFSEVGLYEKTEGKTPEQLIQSVVSGISYKKDTIIVYESTARGLGNFFYNEWVRAVNGDSAFFPFFIAWYKLADNMHPIDNYENFINSMTKYEYDLFNDGATLEHLQWYRLTSKTYPDIWRFKMEFPSNPYEAFQSTGNRFYPVQDVLELRKGVCDPIFIGDIYGKADFGEDAAKDIVFKEERDGALKVWTMPQEERYSDRYVCVVDVGGLSAQSDRSVICVLDRKEMAQGGLPEVVAQWCGHIDHDLLAWKSVQLATAYQEALLIIEANTLETERTEGDHFEYILDEIAYHYNNLFCRVSADKIREGVPPRWGFHTNRSSKQMVCNHHKKALRERLYIEHCKEAVDEHDTFEIKPNGSLGAIDGAHDDMHITRAIGVWACYMHLSAPHLRTNNYVSKKKKRGRGLSQF